MPEFEVVREHIQQALRNLNRDALSASPVARWRSAASRGVGQLLIDGIDRLAELNSEGALILRRHYLDGLDVHVIARELALADGTVNRKQRLAIDELTHLLLEQERQARAASLTRQLARLAPPSYSHLFGVTAHLDALAPRLTETGPPWLLSITGIGGIGKTALADALIRQQAVADQWADIGWVTARQQIFNGGGAIEVIEQPALSADALIDALAQQVVSDEIDPQTLSFAQKKMLLQRRLRSAPHLVVIDNLETLTDVKSLLAALREFANPSKFLLTSRISRIFEGDIFHFVVPELVRSDALALLRQEAAIRNAPGLAHASDAELQPILDTVGGNPLALRLVVGQLHAHPLGRVLDDLRHARGRQATEIYTYIYRQAWGDLDELERQVLLLMPLVTESGGDLDYLAAMAGAAGISAGDVGDALVQLVSRNLVDSRGDLYERRYTIHSLTRAFLQQEILRWPAPDSGMVA
jgi:hypothetical protein